MQFEVLPMYKEDMLQEYTGFTQPLQAAMLADGVMTMQGCCRCT